MDVAAFAEPRQSQDNEPELSSSAAGDTRPASVNGFRTIGDDDGNKFQKAVSAWRSQSSNSFQSSCKDWKLSGHRH